MNLPWGAVTGGALIGAGAVLLLASIGRVAGISGIAAGSLRAAQGERGWRWAFLAGLLASAGLVLWWQSVPAASPRALLRDALPAAVGRRRPAGRLRHPLGQRLYQWPRRVWPARGSKRSSLAVLLFMAFAMLTTFLARHGGAPA